MKSIVIISGLITVVLVVYLVYFHQELRKMVQQLGKIRQRPSNAELQLSSKSRSIIKLARELNEFLRHNKTVYTELQQSTEQFDMAINNITHDLRTPLTVASGYSQYLQQHPELSSKEKNELLAKVSTHLMDVESKLEGLLAYNRIAEQTIQVELAKLNVSQLLEEQLVSCFHSFQDKGIELELEIESNVMLVTDANLLKRMIQNALGNMLTHGERHAKVTLVVMLDHVLLTFSNQTNQHITDYHRLFERFHTEDLARKEKNAGLGLYIIKELSTLLDGTVELSGDQEWFTLVLTLKAIS